MTGSHSDCSARSRATTTTGHSSWFRKSEAYMLIKNLFERDIFRPINGVVKADQLDDSSVWQELDEFVVTRELDQHLRKFVAWYLEAVDQAKSAPTGKMGVWISGFFGSGKSHFLKVLSY